MHQLLAMPVRGRVLRLMVAVWGVLALAAGSLEAATIPASKEQAAKAPKSAQTDKSDKVAASAQKAKRRHQVRVTPPNYAYPRNRSATRLPRPRIDPLSRTIHRDADQHWQVDSSGREVRGEMRELEGLVQKNKQRFHLKVKELDLEEKNYERLQEAAWKAQQALDETRAPVVTAMRAYRKAQNLSLNDPSVSTEKERLTYLQVKSRLKRVVETKETALNKVREQAAHSHKRIGMLTDNMRRLTDETLQVQDRLFKLRQVSFVRLARN